METAGKTIQSFLQALNDEDFKTARSYLTDDMKFVGVMGARDGGDTHIADMQKMKFKYTTQKMFVDGADVSVFYDINMEAATIFCSGWYQLQHNKINSIKVIFDPRPLLEKQ